MRPLPRSLALSGLLAIGVVACDLGFEEPPPDAYLPDDDDSNADDDDDDAIDDDDGAGSDRQAEGVLVEIRETAGDRWVGELSFHDDDGEAFEEFRAGDLDPLPGASLHPVLIPTGAPECVVLSSDDRARPLPAADPVGGVSLWVSSTGTDRTLESGAGAYAGEGEGAVEAGASWDVEVKGGGGWPSGALEADLESRPFLADILPGEGLLGSLAEIHFSWSNPLPGGVEILLRRSTGGDDWIAVRCTSADDTGELRVRADALAPATGPVHVWATRGDWTARPADGDAARLDLGVVRTLHYELTL